jgi:hypothetical protein
VRGAGVRCAWIPTALRRLVGFSSLLFLPGPGGIPVLSLYLSPLCFVEADSEIVFLSGLSSVYFSSVAVPDSVGSVDTDSEPGGQ